jgi:hypothetical protein
VSKITMPKINDTRIFVNEVETQLREKPLWGSQTQDNHYSEDKARYKIVTPTFTRCSGRTLLSNMYPNTNASQPGLLPEGVFNGILYLKAVP